jgi:hypothetical protein
MESLLQIQSNDSILFLAEGNFTFSLSLVNYWIKNYQFNLPKIVSTCFEEKPVSKVAEENVKKLEALGVRVLFSVDAIKWFDFFRT